MKIGVVGLGMGGATAAAAMVRRGLDVTVFEQTREVREVGAGVATWPNTIRLMYRMGLRERLPQIGCEVGMNPIRNTAGEVLHYVPSTTYDDVPGFYLRRSEFLDAIVSLIPRERLRLGGRCVRVEQDAEQATIHLEDGTSASFDAVIGADGIHSTVIHAVIDRSQPPIYANLAAYRGLVANAPGIGLDVGTLWTDRRKYFVAFPVSAGQLINFVGVVPTAGRPEESWFMAGSKEALAQEYEEWDPVVRRIIGQVDQTFRWGLYFREPLPRIVNGRVALLGDAAHPMLIHAGQGLGQALEDGFALGVLLDRAKGDEVPARLRLYNEFRLPRATAVQSLSRHNAQFMHEVFPLQPGDQRPNRASTVEWIVDYDVEKEAEALLAASSTRSSR